MFDCIISGGVRLLHSPVWDKLKEMRRIINIFFIAVLATVSLSGYAQNTSVRELRKNIPPLSEVLGSSRSADSKLIDAVQKYEDGDYSGAKVLLSEILKVQKNDAAWYYRGLCNIKLKDADSAEYDLKQAVSQDSTNYWYRYVLAGFYGMTGRTVLTIDMYESLLKDFPKKSELYYSLANLYINQDQLDKALTTIEEIERQFGKSDATVMTRFDILRQQNRDEEAYEILREYNEEYLSPEVLSILGDYEMGMYNDSAALAYYDEALSLDKGFSHALLGKAEAYRLTRKYPQYFKSLNALMANTGSSAEGKSDYLQAIFKQADPRFIKSFQPQFDSTVNIVCETHPKDTSVLRLSGLYYIMTNRLEQAANSYRTIRDEYPDNAGYAGGYVYVLLYMNDWKGALAAVDSALVKFPDEPLLYDMANTAEYNLQNYRGVIANCEKMIRMAPKDSAITLSAWSTIGDMYHFLGESAKAYKAYDNALKVSPNNVPVLNNYAYYLSLEKKNLKKAYAMSKKTVEAEPDNATYLDTFGWILYLQGKSLEAKPFFKHAMLYGGKESATILNHYAAVLESLGEKDLAKVYRQQAKNKQAEGKE